VDSFLSSLLRSGGSQVILKNVDAGTVVATTVEGAFDSASRRHGLLGRNEFADGSALIIAPSSAIHTFFMQIAIDVVFVSRDGRVLKTYADLPAWRLAFAGGAYAAIELPVGTLSRSLTMRGNRLVLTPR